MDKLILILMISIIGVTISGCANFPPNEPSTTATPTPVVSATTSSSTCDDSLWSHVYHPARLRIIENCKTVKGTVEKIIKEADGDDHIRLRLDPDYSDLINKKNIDEQHGDLVLETICKNPITQVDAIEPCSGFHQDLQVYAGEHVMVTRAYVLDTEHGWNEIHPITSIDNIGG